MDLQTGFREIRDWFFENYVILNTEKCHVMPFYVYWKKCADDICYTQWQKVLKG